MDAFQAIERRVARLERENRRWRLAAVLLVVLLAGVAAVPRQAAAPSIVTAQKMILADSKGLPRLVASGETAGAMQTFLSAEGRPLMRVGVVSDEPRLETWDAKKQAWINWVSPGPVAKYVR